MVVMQVYLVGGAVRDSLLQRKVKEKDWVVVGATPQQMLDLGYKPVGKDFPVFLHPETKEEYALARTERKTALGYHGFDFYTGLDVTLEQDLIRRDLTVNAIAQDEKGNLIDPYHGVKDLKNRVLRHVSDAFAEDPVRILRLARFAARYKPLGFYIAPSTYELMKNMVTKGEVDALIAERVWQEIEKTLSEPNNIPSEFFYVLKRIHALEKLFPALNELFPKNILEYILNHKAQKAFSFLNQAQKNSHIRLASLMSFIEKPAMQSICERYKMPKNYCELCILAIEYQNNLEHIFQYNASEILDFIKKTDALRRTERFYQFLETFGKYKKQVQYIKQCLEEIKGINVQDFVAWGLKGKEMAEAVDGKRLEILEGIKK